MTNWELVIIIGCAVAGFLLVSFVIEVVGSKNKLTDRLGSDFTNLRSPTNDEPVRDGNATRPQPRGLLRAGLVLTLFLLIGYSVVPTTFWNVIGAHLSGLGPALLQTADVVRDRNGSFSVVALVNGARISFVIDTGASAVILTQDAAKAARVPMANLIYSVNVETANGPTYAAATTLEQLTVGGITERSVRALVAQSGQLNTSLLGMSFLNRLDSWAVRGNSLVMQGRP
jgi:clan AA aspartic protease (TIGR02281 family)